ncbi:hypothetical protein WA1_20350 [Scytonema hofmannii PCC 7110]|uniref:DUF5357 domain-containing protein n=1 Tax=Scytonema hofmannii PCC 7110 TaxID=128403 RepID=A0A139XCD1_9CYAN|nr:septal junction protein FraD [Scytonema hofmannii]KYC42326.1 hypothetical protein WA1_20350 [Scytonema hofmannii PCC 7110]
MQIVRDLFGVFTIVGNIYERIKKILIPPKAYSWQTLIYLSIFSWFMSSMSTGFIKDTIAFCGWIFLIFGTAWYTTDSPILVPGTNMPLGAVITGFLVSVFAFGHDESVLTTRTIVLWPTISAIITAIPEFFEGTGTEAKTLIPKIEDRQKIIILIGSCAVISCWLQFYFVTENWLNEYPSLQVDNYQGSAFVSRIESAERIPRNGVVILDKLAPQIEQQLNEQPWSQVEQWLINANQNVGRLGRQVIETNLAQYEEKALWVVEPRVTNLKSGYKLDLLSIWTGPSSTSDRYYLSKTCQIEPVAKIGNTRSRVSDKPDEKNTLAEVSCEAKTSFFAGPLPPQQ